MTMNRAKTMLMLLPVFLATPLATKAWERGKVETFATLPPGEAHPGGSPRTARASMSSRWPWTNPRRVRNAPCVRPQGKHLRTVGIKGSADVLDLGCPQTGTLLVIDYQDAKVLSVDPQTGASSVFMTVTGKDPASTG